MFKYISVLLIFVSIFTFEGFSKDSLLELIKKNTDFSIFYELIQTAKYQELFNKKTRFKKIIYIPNNEAFAKLPDKIKNKIMDEKIAKKIIRTHLFSGEVKEVFKDPKKKVVILERLELSGDTVRIFSNNDLFVKDIVNQDISLQKDKHIIIPVECVMFLQLSSDDVRLSSEEKSKSLITSCCLLTSEEVEAFISDQYL